MTHRKKKFPARSRFDHPEPMTLKLSGDAVTRLAISVENDFNAALMLASSRRAREMALIARSSVRRALASAVKRIDADLLRVVNSQKEWENENRN